MFSFNSTPPNKPLAPPTSLLSSPLSGGAFGTPPGLSSSISALPNTAKSHVSSTSKSKPWTSKNTTRSPASAAKSGTGAKDKPRKASPKKKPASAKKKTTKSTTVKTPVAKKGANKNANKAANAARMMKSMQNQTFASNPKAVPATAAAVPQLITAFDELHRAAKSGHGEFPSPPTLQLEFPIGPGGNRVFRECIVWDLCDPAVPSIEDFAKSLGVECGITEHAIALIVTQMQSQLNEFKRSPSEYANSGAKSHSIALSNKGPTSTLLLNTSMAPQVVGTPKPLSSRPYSQFSPPLVTPSNSPPASQSDSRRFKMADCSADMKKKIKAIGKVMRQTLESKVPKKNGRVLPKGYCHACNVTHREPVYVYCDEDEHAYCKKQLLSRLKLTTDNFANTVSQCSACVLSCSCKMCKQESNARGYEILTEYNGVVQAKHLVSPGKFQVKKSRDSPAPSSTSSSTSSSRTTFVNTLVLGLYKGRKKCTDCGERCNIIDKLCGKCWKIFEDIAVVDEEVVMNGKLKNYHNMAFCIVCKKEVDDNSPRCISCPRTLHANCVANKSTLANASAFKCDKCVSGSDNSPLMKFSVEEIEQINRERSSGTGRGLTICFRKILQELRKHDFAFVFQNSPSPNSLPAEFNEIVKSPMDISKIESKVLHQIYSSMRDFLADVLKMWNDCRAYNSEESAISRMCNTLEHITFNLVKSCEKYLFGSDVQAVKALIAHQQDQ